MKALLSWVLAFGLMTPAFGSAAGASPTGASEEGSVTESAYGGVPDQVYGGNTLFSSYIAAEGGKLMEDGREYRFASLNYPGALGDPAFSQDDALRTIKAMGGKATRSYVPSVLRYDGSNKDSAFILGPDSSGRMQFSEEGFAKMDRMLALANQTGVRVIIPFVDQWQWVGGIESYVNFVYPGTITGDAATDPDGWMFYTDPKVIGLFKQVVHYMMNRINTITGVKYKDDKAILAWETGNELGGYNQDKFPQSWTTEIARYIKEEEQPKQLLLDGRFSINAGSLTDDHIDIVGNHFYTGNFIDKINADAALAAGKKPYILGEFGLYTTKEPVEALYNAALQNGTSGIMIWSLRPHKEDGGFYWHDEDPGNWASYHWPGFASGDYYGETDIIRTVYNYAHYMNALDKGKTSAVPAIAAPEGAPKLFPIDSVADIRWQGVVGASGYEVQRSADGMNWETVAADASDGGRAGTKAFHDEQAITGTLYQYRVRGVNESGASAWSNVVSTTARHLIADEMSLMQNPKENRQTYAYDQSSNVLNKADNWNELGQGFKAYVAGALPGTLTYAAPVPLEAVRIKAEGSGKVRLFVSSVNGKYAEIQPRLADGLWTADGLPAETRYVKLAIDGGSSVLVDRVELEYAYAGQGYRPVPAPVRSGLIVDRSFDGQPDSASGNLAVRGASAGTEGLPVLSRLDGEHAELVYAAAGDMNSYRFTSYVKGGEELQLSASIDGLNYQPLQPAVTRKETADGWSRQVYAGFELPAGTRYIKAAYPAGGSPESPALAKADIGFGAALIPLTEAPPANVLEDGEYDYGKDDSIAARYERDQDGGEASIALDAAAKNRGSYGAKLRYELGSASFAGLSRPIGHADLSSFDALHAWVKPDGSGNRLGFRLFTGDGRIWEAAATLGGTAARTLEVKLADFTLAAGDVGRGPIDLSDVTGFGLYVGKTDGASPAAGTIVVDDVRMANASKLDNFEGYGGYNALVQKAFARNTGGGALDVSLDGSRKSEGDYGLRMDYDFSGPGYAGGSFSPDYLKLDGYDGFSFWLQPDGSNNELAIQFSDDAGKFWETKAVFRGSDPRLMYVPFSAFRYPSWYGGDPGDRPDPSRQIKTFSLYLGGSPDSLSSSGTLYVDDIQGADFTDRLNAASIAIRDSGAVIGTLPYTLSGTASGAEFVRIQVGKQTFHAPVKPDGTWSYTTSKIANGMKEATAAIELFDGTVLHSSTAALNVNVPGNPYDDGTAPAANNRLLNPGFEEAVDAGAWPVLPKHWSSKDAEGAEMTSGIVKLEGGARSDQYALVHWNDQAYEVTTSQEADGLEPGIYELKAWTKSKGGQITAEMTATGDQGAVRKAAIPQGESSWASVKLSGLEVRDGKLAVGFHSQDSGGNWIKVDDVSLIKTADLPGGGATPTPTPGGGATPTPGGGATPTPGGGATPTPGGEATPTPGGGATPTPGGEATPTPGGGATPTPGGGATPTPGGEATPTPGGEATPTPGGEATPTPGGAWTPMPSETPSPTSATPAPSAIPAPSLKPSPSTKPVPSFGDLGGTDWARSAIEEMAAKGIMLGVGGDKFAPDKPLTRAEFITALFRAFRLDAAETAGGLSDVKPMRAFSDVKPDAWYAEAVAAAARLGIAGGTGAGKFEPNRAITREEMAVMAANALKHLNRLMSADVNAELAGFKDRGQIAGYARSSVAQLAALGVMNGAGADGFAPKGKATRAQAAVVLQRMLKLLE
ncbi:MULTISPECIES: S-layer homology domain-containing protein [unclassified Paenibacillus]|uniref:S-layer homology domain-containing protein n=1 Tax=unclassified Paenibacillus TaxID=185978 RepID=UPI000B926D19|nr:MULTISPECIES: S-layer homology domain-containing protein [unclassified Paenibacillus]